MVNRRSLHGLAYKTTPDLKQKPPEFPLVTGSFKVALRQPRRSLAARLGHTSPPPDHRSRSGIIAADASRLAQGLKAPKISQTEISWTNLFFYWEIFNEIELYNMT